jgi:preprotein translocase subunit SecF
MGVRGLGHRLYTGEVSYDFVGRRKLWYLVSGLILTVVVLSLVFRGLNLGIEFTGGAEFQFTATNCDVQQTRDIMAAEVEGQSIVTQIGDDQIRVQTVPLTTEQSDQLTATIAEQCGVPQEDIKIQLVGPTWGQDISKKALQGLLVFLVLVSIFLAVYFEWRMAVAALVALAHDLLITVGIYSILGFEVTPATLIGVLTILGYSLYDTVVVFDKVKENTRGIASQSRVTYSQAANLAVNQTLVRSINTSIVALLPVGAILFVGWGVLGAGTLKDLALALFVGIAAGTYSSIFVATPLLAQLKERDPAMQAVARRVAARGKSATATADVESVKKMAAVTSVTASDLPMSTVVSTGERVQPRKQTRSQRKPK